jgi:hypothetical protein
MRLRFLQVIMKDGTEYTCGSAVQEGNRFEIVDTGKVLSVKDISKVVQWNGFESKIVFEGEVI